MSIRDKWLLPEGIEEVLPPDARRLEDARREILDLYARWGSPLLAGVAMLGILVVLGGLFGGQIAVAVFALAVTTLGVAFARVSVDLARSSSEELQRVRKEAEASLQELQRAREALERMSPPPADEG